MDHYIDCDGTYILHMANHPSHPDDRDGILMILRKSLIHVRWLSQNTDWEIQLVLIITCKMQNEIVSLFLILANKSDSAWLSLWSFQNCFRKNWQTETKSIHQKEAVESSYYIVAYEEVIHFYHFITIMQKLMKIFIIIANGINGFVRYLVSKVSTLESCVSLERTRVNIKYWTLHAMWSKLNSNLYQFSSKRSFHRNWVYSM